MDNVKNDAICHVTRQNQYNPAGGGATIITALLLLLYLKWQVSNRITNLSKIFYNTTVYTSLSIFVM